MKPIAMVAAALLAGAWITGSNAEPLDAPVASAASDWLVLADLSTTTAGAIVSYASSRSDDAAGTDLTPTPDAARPSAGRRGMFEASSPLPIFVALSGPNPTQPPSKFTTASLAGHVTLDGSAAR